MSQFNYITEATGCTARQLERWTKHGVLARPMQHGKRPSRGGGWQWPDDTVTRVLIIQDCIRRHQSLNDAAFELFLIGYALYNDELVRRVLLSYVDTAAHVMRAGQRSEVKSDNPVQERRNITRRVDTHGAAFPAPLLTAIKSAFVVAAGVAKSGSDEDVLQGHSLQEWRIVVESATHEQLRQAVTAARRYVQQTRTSTKRGIYHDLNASPDDIARIALARHVCTTHHSIEEALLPFFTVFMLAVQAHPLGGNPGIWTSHAGELLATVRTIPSETLEALWPSVTSNLP